jgi:hypothetical protein
MPFGVSRFLMVPVCQDFAAETRALMKEHQPRRWPRDALA